MCGITGVYDPRFRHTPDETLLTSMADAISHRGPDESSVFIARNIGFGFRRLSIMDVANGHQPFFNQDRSIVLICNGEIYNYHELRLELQGKGCRFTTNCDVEVILHLYIVYGINFLNKLNGQFAFSIFDRNKEMLFLARDQFGICPLFYTSVDGLFVFGSEIKAIIQHPLVKKEVDLQGLDQVFTFPGLVSPVTMFRNIFCLPPGHFLIVDRDKLEVCEYWDLVYPEEPGADGRSEEYYINELEEKLLKSVKYRLNADVPVGFYLSGGLDSSLIGAMMKAVNPAIEYSSFSIGFPWDSEMNERAYQQQVARFLKISNTEIIFNSSEVEKKLKQAVWTAESALKESYNTCSLALSEMVNNNGLKVVLSGEGADELFGGYVGYRFDKNRMDRGTIKNLDDEFEDETRTKLWGDPDFFYEKNYYEFDGVKRALYSDRLKEKLREFSAVENLCFNKERIRNRHVFHRRSYIDLKLRLSDHLIADHCDRVTYANSVEGRFPFLDIELVEFAKTIPPGIKLKGLNEKYILKQVARKYLPGNVIDRQKFGFVAPGSPSLLREDIEWINDLLSYERIKKQGYFDPAVVDELKNKYKTPGFKLNLPYESDLLIIILTFNIFLELFDMPDVS